MLVKRTQRTIKSPYHGQTCNVKSPSYAGSQNGTTAHAKQARPSKWSLDCVEQIFDTSSKERLLVMFPALSILASFAAINSKDSHFRPLLSTSHTTFISCISKIHDKHFSSLRVAVPTPREKTGGRERLRKAGTNRVM